MKIEILGDSCSKCKTLEKKVRKVAAEQASGAEITVTNDPVRLAEYGLLTLPGLAVDGELKSRGEVLSEEEIRRILA